MKNIIYTEYRPVARYMVEGRLAHTAILADRIAGFIVRAWKAFNTMPLPPAVMIDGRAMTPDAEHFMRFMPR